MKSHLIALLPLALLGAPALAGETALSEIADSDGNGIWSLAELQTVWPDLTAEVFAAIDTNFDGNADMAEVTAALTSGVLMPVE